MDHGRNGNGYRPPGVNGSAPPSTGNIPTQPNRQNAATPAGHNDQHRANNNMSGVPNHHAWGSPSMATNPYLGNSAHLMHTYDSTIEMRAHQPSLFPEQEPQEQILAGIQGLAIGNEVGDRQMQSQDTLSGDPRYDYPFQRLQGNGSQPIIPAGLQINENNRTIYTALRQNTNNNNRNDFADSSFDQSYEYGFVDVNGPMRGNEFTGGMNGQMRHGSPDVLTLQDLPPASMSACGSASASRGPELEQTIPNAIVIKNIPFHLKIESLQAVIKQLALPTAHAMNYHFAPGKDGQKSFHGLCFANYKTAEEANAVINGLNGSWVDGRELRVELKKELPADKKEKNEQRKREERRQTVHHHIPLREGETAPLPKYQPAPHQSIGTGYGPHFGNGHQSFSQAPSMATTYTNMSQTYGNGFEPQLSMVSIMQTPVRHLGNGIPPSSITSISTMPSMHTNMSQASGSGIKPSQHSPRPNTHTNMGQASGSDTQPRQRSMLADPQTAVRSPRMPNNNTSFGRSNGSTSRNWRGSSNTTSPESPCPWGLIAQPGSVSSNNNPNSSNSNSPNTSNTPEQNTTLELVNAQSSTGQAIPSFPALKTPPSPELTYVGKCKGKAD
ncbi:hypothetical protein V8E51_013580 [Hyaloscypha variabilis]